MNDCDPAHFHGYVLEFDLARVAAARLQLQDGVLEERDSRRSRASSASSSTRDFDEFVASVDQVVSLHNFFYADRRGNIAYWSAGARPAFPAGFDDRLPADGTGSQEWGTHPGGQRYVPFSRSLVSINPTQGYLVNWNTKPADRALHPGGQQPRRALGRDLPLRSHRVPARQQRLDELEGPARRSSATSASMDGSTDTVRAAAPFLVPAIRTRLRRAGRGERARWSIRRPTRRSARRSTVLDEWQRLSERRLADLSRRALQPDLQPVARPGRACRSSSSGGTR